jgi:hypothetical protein
VIVLCPRKLHYDKDKIHASDKSLYIILSMQKNTNYYNSKITLLIKKLFSFSLQIINVFTNDTNKT